MNKAEFLEALDLWEVEGFPVDCAVTASTFADGLIGTVITEGHALAAPEVFDAAAAEWPRSEGRSTLSPADYARRVGRALRSEYGKVSATPQIEPIQDETEA